MRKSAGLVFEGAIELAAEVADGGDFSRLSLHAEASAADGRWDLRGVDEVGPESVPGDPLARTADVVVYRLDPDAFDSSRRKDGTSDSRVVMAVATFPRFSGYVREATLYVRGGARFGTGLVAVIQRFPRVWASEDFLFRSRFVLDMRG